VWHVVVDLAYRVAYAVDPQGVTQQAQSGVTRGNVRLALDAWGFKLAPNGEWVTTDILNAVDAVRHPIVWVNSAN
jgi:hypothetical protein